MAGLLTTERARLARSLPPQLLSFFTKHPPAALLSTPPSTPHLTSLAGNTSSMDPNASPSTETTLASPTPPTSTPEATDAGSRQDLAPRRENPFLPWLHPVTRAWHPPQYSLRRQADLIKLAEAHNVTSLLPWSPKLPAEKERKRIENGLRVKGTGVGQRVKGKLWERTLKGRLEARRVAMEGMGDMIRQWKERGHGRGWKKWPK